MWRDKVLKFIYIFSVLAYPTGVVYLERQKITSDSENVCGIFVGTHTEYINDWRATKYNRFELETVHKQKYYFSLDTSFLSIKLSPYGEENKQVLESMRIGDRICVTYSLIFDESQNNAIPYLIKVRFN